MQMFNIKKTSVVAMLAVAMTSGTTLADPIAHRGDNVLAPVSHQAVSILKAPLDVDGDGWADANDNCVFVFNPDQIDGENDRIGNRCDSDLDNTCWVTMTDYWIFQESMFTSDPVADLDASGTVNFADLPIIRGAMFTMPGPSGLDNICN